MRLPPPRPAPIGPRGEAEAARAYERRGARVLARNERNACGEIDLVVLDRGVLVAVEVKTRTHGADGAAPKTGAPAEAVTRSRVERLGRALDLFALRRGEADARRRVDVAEVVVGRDGAMREIRLLTNVSG